MKTLLLVDGHNLLFKMFFGMPFPFQNENGQDITATVGFVGNVVKMIKYLNATDCLVVFDGESSLLEKSQIDVNYKANRVKDYGALDDKQNPFTQLVFIKAMLGDLSIAWVEAQDCESDDLISSIAINSRNKTFISSTDSDFFQLVGPNVKVLQYKGDKTVIVDEKYVINKFGVLPSEFCLYKALVGDPTDNITGVSKVGPKTAQKVILGLRENIVSDILKTNESLIAHNIELIRQPREIFPYNRAYPIDNEKLKNFKPLRDINEVTKRIHTEKDFKI